MASRLTIRDYLAVAKKYYASDAYKADAREIADLLRDIHDRVIAVDLEKTLVSNNFGSTGENIDPNLLAVLPSDAGVFYVRRPLAAEMVDALSDKNTVLYWTACTRARAKLILFACDLPAFPNLICRETNALAMVAAGLISIDEQQQDSMALYGEEKIPSVHDSTHCIDALLDDAAQNHALSCFRRNRSRDIRRIVPAPAFPVHILPNLALHHLDRGLLVAARSLKERLATL